MYIACDACIWYSSIRSRAWFVPGVLFLLGIKDIPKNRIGSNIKIDNAATENGAAIAIDAPPSEQNLEAISFTLEDYVDAEEEAKQEAHADVAEAFRTPTKTQWNEFLWGIRTEVVTQAEAATQGRTTKVLLAEDAANTYPRPFPRVLKVGDRVSFDIRNQVVGLLARCGEVARITNEYIYIENDYIGQTHRYTKRSTEKCGIVLITDHPF